MKGKVIVSKTVAREGRCIVALGRQCWGRGENAAVALRNARREGKPTAKGFMLLDAPADAYVDEMGYVCWKTGAGIERPVEIGFAGKPASRG